MGHIHILGICGTFMGSVAQLAKALGYRVTGSDRQVYPPMSTQLEQVGIELIDGFDPKQLSLNPDLVIVGNVISRGNPVLEEVLNRGIPYTSGPQWFAEHVLNNKWVLAVSGTHGKTTTSSMLAWILEFCGFQPGYLIGGVPRNFTQSARLGQSDFFVVEADEYDSAFFDKRSKFVHYRPRTLVINNIEFDHADIFHDLAAIQTQFHHLVRTVPSDGLIISPANELSVDTVFDLGYWSERQGLGQHWLVENQCEDGREFEVAFNAGDDIRRGRVSWSLTGKHNINNALAAIAAARHVGVDVNQSCQALCKFEGVKRRMELLTDANGTRVYDDFAHHPTAIKSTIEGLRASCPSAKITAVVEMRSNTMRRGVHKDSLTQACDSADSVYWLQPSDLPWTLIEGGAETVIGSTKHTACSTTDEIVSQISGQLESGEQVVVMSNGGFNGIHNKLVKEVQRNYG